MKALLFTILTIAVSLSPLQTPGGRGSISGIVIQAGTDRPIDGVQISLTLVTTATGPPQSPAGGFTDPFGRFEIGNLAAGRYRIQWTRGGYFTPPVGTAAPDASIIQNLKRLLGRNDLAIASPPSATSVTVDVGPEEVIGGFVFTLVPGGVISGRVLDPMGNPLVSAPLVALSVNYEDGYRVLQAGGNTVVSDDRGNFRLFGLRPGEYYVRVDTRQSSSTSPVVRAYFPGVSAVTDAVPIVVNENGESPGANFSIPFSGTVKIAGTVVAPGNMNLSDTRFYLAPAQADQLNDLTAILFPNALTLENRTAGEFELRGAAPGQFALYAVLFDSVQMRYFSGRFELSIGAQDYRSVFVELRPSGDVRGRLVLEDGTPVRRALNLRPRETLSSLGRNPSSLLNANADGSFVVLQVPETRYTLTAGSPDTCIVDIRQGGKSVYDSGFIGGVDAESIEVVVGNPCGTVQVQIVDDRKQPVSNAFVSLVPAVEHRRNPQLYRRSVFDAAAAKYPPISLIPPGEYKMFAWDNIPPNAELNAAFLAQFEDRGVPVTVRRGELLTVQLPLISTGK